MLSSLSKPWVEFWLSMSEWALLICGIALSAGVFGEYLADHKKKEYPLFKKYKHRYEVLVIIAIAGELLADGGVFMFGSHLQTIADAELAQASKDAALAIQQAAASNKEAANARLETARLEKQLSPRFIADQPGMATNLSKYEGTRAVIFCDTESRSLGLAIPSGI